MKRGIVLHRKESFGDDQVEHHREGERAYRDEQGRALVQQHPIEPNTVAFEHRIEEAPLRVLVRDMSREHPRTHHRRQRQGYHEGNQNGNRQRDREFVKQPTDHIAHEQQRNQHRDQRQRE